MRIRRFKGRNFHSKGFHIESVMERELGERLAEEGTRNWVRTTDALYKTMQHSILARFELSEDRRAMAANALTEERHFLKAARLTMSGEGMQRREAIEMIEKTLELAKRQRERWIQEHGEDKASNGMLIDIESIGKLCEREKEKDPEGRILFNPPFNEVIRTMRKFIWLELEQALGVEGFKFYQAQEERGAAHMRQRQEQLRKLADKAN